VRQAWPHLRLGALIGAGATRTDIDSNAGTTDSNLVFGGGFARYGLGASVLHLGVPSESVSVQVFECRL
jgi:hypothetical protein